MKPRFFLPPLLVFVWLHSLQAVPVTFRVDMSIQESIGRFDPAQDVVELRGGFNIWEGGDIMTPTADNQGVYEITMEIPDDPGATVPYKFVIFDAAGTIIWESDVGDGQTNRTFILANSAQEIPQAYFDNLEVDPGAGVDVTFQVNMAARLQQETFDPETDFVEVRGPFNNWAEGDRMTPIVPGSPIYHTTLTVKFIRPGDDVPYKYMINASEWETDENRLFELQDTAHTLPVRFFDDIEPIDLGPLGTLEVSLKSPTAINLRWQNPKATLQGSEDLTSDSWNDVPVDEGITETTISTDLAPSLFFRIVLR